MSAFVFPSSVKQKKEERWRMERHVMKSEQLKTHMHTRNKTQHNPADDSLWSYLLLCRCANELQRTAGRQRSELERGAEARGARPRRGRGGNSAIPRWKTSVGVVISVHNDVKQLDRAPRWSPRSQRKSETESYYNVFFFSLL